LFLVHERISGDLDQILTTSQDEVMESLQKIKNPSKIDVEGVRAVLKSYIERVKISVDVSRELIKLESFSEREHIVFPLQLSLFSLLESRTISQSLFAIRRPLVLFTAEDRHMFMIEERERTSSLESSKIVRCLLIGTVFEDHDPQILLSLTLTSVECINVSGK